MEGNLMDAEAWFDQGNKLFNLGQLEEAVASFDQALDIKPDYHQAWLNRGIALEKLGKFEEALSSFDQVLKFQPDLYPNLYATYFNQGRVLDHLGRFEEALFSFEQALKIQPNDQQSWYNQGIMLFQLGQLGAAVASYDQAVKIQPDLHDAWYNWGIALNNLGQLEEAVASFEQALKIQPDFHEAWRNRGAVLDDLGEFEEAIASYDQALKIQPDLHDAWNNRGAAAGRSVSCNSFLASQSPIARQYPKLNQRGYEGALASFEQGLKHCFQDTHPEGWGRLHQAIGNAHYFRGHGDSRPRPYLQKAVKSYKKARQALTAEAFPEAHLEVLQNLIRVYDYLGEAENFQALLARGTVVLEGLLEKTPSDAVKIRLSRQFASFAQYEVDKLVQQGDLCGALEFAEQRKNICLGWMRNIWSKSTNSPNYIQMQKLLQPVGAVPPCPPNSPCPPDSVPIQLSRGKDGKIYVTLSIQRQSFGEKAIVYWHISSAAITTFILRYGQPPIILSAENGESGSVFLPSLSELGGSPDSETPASLHQLIEFEKWLETWKKSENLRAEMPELLEKLAKILNIEAILSHLKGINQLILIPHRDLHLLPLHALFNLPSPLVGEGQGVRGIPSAEVRGNFTISYLPSIKVGLDRTHPNPNTSLLSIENPTKDLKYAPLESEAICQLYPKAHRIAASNATKTAVKIALAQNFDIFHFTGHGKHNTDQPAESALILANNERLTLKDILELNLSNYNLACLAACETNFSSKSLIDEFIGLASGFVAAGVNNVIGSLWIVDDCSTAYLMKKFHEILRSSPQKNVPSTLQEAQDWLRNATNAELDQFPLQIGQNRDFGRLSDQEIAENSSPNHKPYASPYHWAGFCAIGL